MTRGPLVIDGLQLLSEAMNRMEQLGVHHLPVIEGARLAGMLTETDVLRCARPGAMVNEAMSANVLTVGLDEPVARVASAMIEQRLDAATVVCDGRIAGIFTASDALRLVARSPDAGAETEELRAWPRRVLCAVDLSETSRAAVAPALRLAGPNGEVTLFHVYDLTLAGIVAGLSGPEERRLRIEKTLARWIREHDRAGGPRILSASAPGEPAEAIEHLAREGHFDVVVVASHGRTGARRLLLGSVAEAVARRAPCPVLVVRSPPGTTA